MVLGMLVMEDGNRIYVTGNTMMRAVLHAEAVMAAASQRYIESDFRPLEDWGPDVQEMFAGKSEVGE